MLTLVNTNRMVPPIAPIGLDYTASSLAMAGYDVELLDLCMAADPTAEIERYFSSHTPELIGLSFRNTDDCFWPSATSFVSVLQRDIAGIRARSDAPIVLGGAGYSLFAERILRLTGADFGVRGDGEAALASLLSELRSERKFERVPGLIYRHKNEVRMNSPAWPRTVSLKTQRDFVDNSAYFAQGGQIGVETKRGCARRCIYCADPVVKGHTSRTRDPRDVADEIECLLQSGIDVLHLCDPEFNLPPAHASDVCEELIRRQLGRRLRWYAYLAVVPFSDKLAALMRRAGCVGINFTSDAASPAMLQTYGQPHRFEDLQSAVTNCRRNGISVMLDMLLGGPGETVDTLTETIRGFQQLNPDCAGAALGVRVYPGTPLAHIAAQEGPWETNPNLRRRCSGPVDLLQPTFYISAALGDRPADLVRDLIGSDHRFFPPQPESGNPEGADHNYSGNRLLVERIAAGERGAYWDILRRPSPLG